MIVVNLLHQTFLVRIICTFYSFLSVAVGIEAPTLVALRLLFVASIKMRLLLRVLAVFAQISITVRLYDIFSALSLLLQVTE